MIRIGTAYSVAAIPVIYPFPIHFMLSVLQDAVQSMLIPLRPAL